MKILYRVILFIILFETNLFAFVNINYPGIDTWLTGEDTKLPGIPSKDIDEYKHELYLWSKESKKQIYLDQATINKYIEQSLDLGFDTNVTMQIDEEYHVLYNKNISIADLMRDVIFLETMQKSIKDWNDEYINKQLDFSETYKRAVKIWAVYQDYMDLGNFNKDHNNPIINALFGSGGNTYRNIFLSDGTIEKIYEDRLITLADSSISSILGNKNFIDSIYENTFNKLTAADITANFFINILKQYDGEIGQLVDNLSTIAFGVSSTGLGLIFTAPLLFASNAEFIATSFLNSSKGAHLINYYYFTKHYPDYTKQYLLNQDKNSLYYGVIDNFINLNELINVEDLSNDKVASALANAYYKVSNSATIQEAKAAYSIAGLFLTVEKLDIENLKENLVARVNIENVRKQGFLLKSSYDENNDQYQISIPNNISYNTDHGGYPVTISYKLNNQSIFTVFPNSISDKHYIGETDLIDNISLALSKYDATKKDSILDVTILFNDNFQMSGSSKLIFYPQISDLELIKTTSGKIIYENENKMHITYCGDNIHTIDLFYKNQNLETYYVLDYELNSNNETSNDDNCKTHYLVLDTNKLKYNAGYGNIDFYAKAALKNTDIITLTFIDPNDTDSDKLPDSWEEKYFGNLLQSSNDDYDHDQKTNYQEYVIDTDPTKTGFAEIIRTITFKPYYNINGELVNNYYLYGEINSHVILESGTINLNGKALTINGNLDLNGGILFINDGKLIVKGSLISSGSSKLKMINPDDMIEIYGDMEIEGSSSIKGNSPSGGTIIEKFLTNGTIKLKGNFKQKGLQYGFGDSSSYSHRNHYWMNSNNRFSFCAYDSHTVVFNGTAKQAISYSSTNSMFNNIILDNTSNEGVDFKTVVYASGSIQSKETNIINAANLHLQNNGSIEGVWNSDLTVNNGWLLSKNQEINGNFYLTGGTLDLTGNTLNINKNMHQSAGNCYVNKGKLLIMRNFISTGSSKLRMINHEDHIIVNGDMEIGGSSSIKGDGVFGGNIVESYLTNGTIELKGDFRQKGNGDGFSYTNNKPLYYWMNSNNKYSFYTSGNHTVVFNGTAKQTISYSSTNSMFNNMILDNTSNEGVDFKTVVYASSSIQSKETNIINAANVHLQNNGSIEGVWNSDLTVNNGWLLSKNQEINGNFYLTGGTLDLTGNALTINKNMLHYAGNCFVNKGKLTIMNDFITSGTSKLKMINIEDIIIVNGDMEVGGSSTILGNSNSGGTIVESYLTNGTIKLKGNFRQKGVGNGFGNNKSYPYQDNYWMNGNNKYSFHTSGNHTVILNGTSKQSVSYSSTSSMFNILILENITEDGVFFTTNFAVNKLFNHNQNSFVLSNLYSFNDYDNDGIKDHLDDFPIFPNNLIKDIDNNGVIEIVDALIALKICSNQLNINLENVIYILKILSSI